MTTQSTTVYTTVTAPITTTITRRSSVLVSVALPYPSEASSSNESANAIAGSSSSSAATDDPGFTTTSTTSAGQVESQSSSVIAATSSASSPVSTKSVIAVLPTPISSTAADSAISSITSSTAPLSSSSSIDTTSASASDTSLASGPTNIASGSSTNTSSASSTSVLPTSSISASSSSSTSASFTSSTNTSSTSSSASISTKTATGSHISSGEVAGVAIGCLLLGAVIAAIAVWLLLRRKSGGQNLHEMEPKAAQGPATVPGSGATAYGVSDPSDVLPQPMDSTTMGKQLSHLHMLISQHVQQNFYVETKLDPGVMAHVDAKLLSRIAGGMLQPSQLSDGLINIQTRKDAIIFVIAASVFRNLDANNPRAKLLPPVSAAFARTTASMAAKQDGREQLLSRWRVITGYLQTDQYVTNAFSTTDERIAGVDDTVNAINDALRPLVNGVDDQRRRNNLRILIQKAALFGHTLVSQPSVWAFDWSTSRSNARSLAILPCLLQMTNDKGQRLSAATSVGEKKVSRDFLPS